MGIMNKDYLYENVMSRISKNIKDILCEIFGGSTPALTESKGTYNGMRYISNKIKRTADNMMYGNFGVNDGIDCKVRQEGEGGIIVFSTEANTAQLFKYKFINYGLVDWTIGYYFAGRYKAKDGNTYDENSLSLELIGISTDTLIKIAGEICKDFQQESVLVKDYSSDRIVFVNADCCFPE